MFPLVLSKQSKQISAFRLPRKRTDIKPINSITKAIVEENYMLASIGPILYYSGRGTISFCSYADTSLNILNMIPLNHLPDDNFIHEFRIAENPCQKFTLAHIIDLSCHCSPTFICFSNPLDETNKTGLSINKIYNVSISPDGYYVSKGLYSFKIIYARHIY